MRCVRETYLFIPVEVAQLLHLEQVSLNRQQSHIGVCEDGGGDGGKFQTVLL